MDNGTFVYETTEYKLNCEIISDNPRDRDGVVKIASCKGHASVIVVPQTMEYGGEMKTVKYIGKKAFLGKHRLRRIELPGTIELVEDFAFAQCSRLSTVVLKRKPHLGLSIFGRKVFEDCTSLMDICLGNGEKNTLSALLGAIPVRLYDEYLLSDTMLGSREWYTKWDNKLKAFIAEDDEDGYTDLALCGEEDIKSDVPEFVTNKRMQKAALCLLRLINNDMLSDASRALFTEYILAHKKGAATDEAWRVILRDFGDDLGYYKLFYELGGIDVKYIDDMLLDMGERHAEAKAYLMSLKQEAGEYDIFDSLTL